MKIGDIMENKIKEALKGQKYWLFNEHLCKPLDSIDAILKRFKDNKTSKYYFIYDNNGKLTAIKFSRKRKDFYDSDESFTILISGAI